MKKVFEGVFEEDSKLFTLSSGSSPFDDPVVKLDGREYREWQVTRSKLAAALAKGLRLFPFTAASKVLYLGAAHGYTCSHVSDACVNGTIFALEFAPRVARELILLADTRKNLLPILADANMPQSYYHLLNEVDVVYQDIAQRNQVEILVKNCDLFLKRGGYALVAIKARSIDVTRKPMQIFTEVKKQLEEAMTVLDYRNLEPFQKDHAFFVCQKK